MRIFTTALSALAGWWRQFSLTIGELIKKLEALDPRAPVVLDNESEYSEVDMVMKLDSAVQAYPGSRSWIDADPGEGGVTCYVVR